MLATEKLNALAVFVKLYLYKTFSTRRSFITRPVKINLGEMKASQLTLQSYLLFVFRTADSISLWNWFHLDLFTQNTTFHPSIKAILFLQQGLPFNSLLRCRQFVIFTQITMNANVVSPVYLFADRYCRVTLNVLDTLMINQVQD